MTTIKLKIVTPREVFLEDKFEMVTLPSFDGVLAILKDHVPILASLRAGQINTYLNGSVTKKIIINSGVLTFSNNEAIILVEEVISKEKYHNEFITNKISELQNNISNYVKIGDDEALNKEQQSLNDILTIKELL